jgi:iron complex outermembrane receptor protein
MSIQSTPRARLASRGATIRSLRLTSACVAVLAAAAGAAHADTQGQASDTSASAPDANAVKEVVVTGIRKSLQDSVAIKRKSDEVVEVISSEDIGKLPDESIADSLTRLPGLAGQRVGGRYQDIAIRGLSPDFTATLLNGFTQASTGDNRSAEFDQYPSELISGAEVYKTPSATLVGQGLAGTVDLHTLNPLDLSKRTFAVNVRGSTNSLGSLIPGFSSTGNRISGAYIDQFMGGKVGLSIGVAHMDAPEMERWYQTWWWAPQTAPDGLGGSKSLTPTNPDAQAAQGNDMYAYARRVTRDAFMTTLEFKPTANFHSVNNIFGSKFRQTEEMRGVNIIEPIYQDPNQTVTNPVFQTLGGQLLNTGGTINEIQPIFQSYYNTRNDDELSFISRNTWDVGGWHLGGDLSYSYAQRQEHQYQEYMQYGASAAGTPDSVTYANTANTNGFPQWTPSGNLNYADASKIYLDNPQAWGGWGHDGLLHAPTTTDTIAEGKLHAKHEITGWGSGFFKQVEFGFDYSDRTKKKSESDFNLDIPGATVDAGNNLTGSGSTLTMQLPSAVVSSPVNLGWAGFGNIFGFDPQKLIKYYNFLPIANEGQYSNNWHIEEKLATPYLKLDIDSELFTLPVTGNLGFQYVYATQDSAGYITQGLSNGMANFQPISHSKSYGEFLPSLNLRFALPANQAVRLGLAKEMSRPRLDQLVANTSAGVSLPTDHSPGSNPNNPQPCTPSPSNTTTCYGTWSGNGGNPDLKPWMATAFDATYEKYFGRDKASYFAVQYYYKELSTYVYEQTTNFDFAGYPNLNAYPVNPNGGTIGPNTRWANGQGGHIEGLEIAGTLGGKLISPWVGDWVDGFGLSGSIAKAWTTILQNGPKYFADGSSNPQYDPSVPLEGLSGTVASWTAYYEKYGFSARISERYRAPFYADVGGLFASINKVEVAADNTFDAQVSYDVPWGMFKGLTLLVQGYNITNSPYRQFASTTPNSVPTNLKYYQDYGRTILFGFNYKF